MPDPMRVYFSHAPHDAESAETLDRHLSLLKREGLIESWRRSCLQPGTQTGEESECRFAEANVILLLLSADFVASDACFAELERARRRHKEGTALVRLLLLRPVDCDAEALRGLPVLPPSGQPIALWSVPDMAFAEVAAALRRHVAQPATQQLVTPVPRDPFSFDVFISYEAKEPLRSWVRRSLVHHLEQAGLRVMLNVRDFRLGVPLLEEIERGVQDSRRTLAVLSPGYLMDGFATLERVMAQHMGRENGETRLVAILRESCQPRLLLRISPPLDMTNEEQAAESLPRLIEELRRPLGQ